VHQVGNYYIVLRGSLPLLSPRVTISISIKYIVRSSNPVLRLAILTEVGPGLPQTLHVSDSIACCCHWIKLRPFFSN